MIDLHLHTTASDGRCSPSDLVQRVGEAGVRVFAVTDHDTVAAHGEAAAAAEAAGLTFVPGIEVSAVWAGRDVHVLGYWVNHQHAGFLTFLDAQRRRRIERVAAIGRALAYAGAPIDVGPLLDDLASRPGASIGRPTVARALVDAGKAESVQDAFDRLLGEGQPAFVPRTGVPPLEAVREIHAAGGLASLAHPGVSRCDDQIATWARGGLDAIEVYHSDHSGADQEKYLQRAAQLRLAVTGGSDFHGDDGGSKRSHDRVIGGIGLPEACWQPLLDRAAHRRS